MLVKLENVSKEFKNKKVLQQINLEINQGDIIGIIGENGVGKTTLFKMILNVMPHNGGTIEIFNELEFNIDNYKRIGTLIETPVFYNNLTVNDNLSIHLNLMKKDDTYEVKEVLKMVELDYEEVANKKISKLSLGMKQRVAIARAIIHKPELVILDEPINGLDPTGVKLIRNLILKLNKENNMTFIISSHLLSELENVTGDIYLLTNRKLEHLAKSEKKWIVKTNDLPIMKELFYNKFNYHINEFNEEEQYILIDNMTKEVKEFIFDNNQYVIGFNEYEPSLEKRFIEMKEKADN